MLQQHYEQSSLRHQITSTTHPENAIAIPENWTQPDFKFGDVVKANEGSYIVIGLAMDANLDIWKYLCRSGDNTERFFWEYQLERV